MTRPLPHVHFDRWRRPTITHCSDPSCKLIVVAPPGFGKTTIHNATQTVSPFSSRVRFFRIPDVESLWLDNLAPEDHTLSSSFDEDYWMRSLKGADTIMARFPSRACILEFSDEGYGYTIALTDRAVLLDRIHDNTNPLFLSLRLDELDRTLDVFSLLADFGVPTVHFDSAEAFISARDDPARPSFMVVLPLQHHT